MITGFTVKEDVAPGGTPAAASVTAPIKSLTGVTVTS
jgi:hypothetical protein